MAGSPKDLKIIYLKVIMKEFFHIQYKRQVLQNSAVNVVEGNLN